MIAMDTARHWETIYSTKTPNQLGWFRPHLETSLALIERAAREPSAPIIDVGGGTSSLVDDLLARGYRDVTVLDISKAALDLARRRLGGAGQSVRWLQADVTQVNFYPKSYWIWHDRAVFHFLTQPDQRIAYVRNVLSAVRPGGHVIVSTFGPEGPEKCSGLEVVRYDAAALHEEFGGHFRLIESSKELHQTPSGGTQQFLYCYCRLEQAVAK